MKYTFKVPKTDERIRLNMFLKQSGVSSALVRRIKFFDDGILVDGVKRNTDYFLTGGETVEINTSDEDMTSTVIPQEGALDIVYLDRCVMVVNKPAFMPCHPSFNHPTDTVANYFAGYFNKKGENKIARIINRLDRNTSGLVLIALDAHTAEKLKGTTEKIYTAIVEGKVTPTHDIIDAPIAREAESIITRCVRADGQRAVTEYDVIKQNDDISLVSVKLHTGRTHQIRVHFSYRGHPLLGDDLYGGNTDRISRHALHCGSLSFVTPDTGEKITICAPMPDDMSDIAQTIAENV